MIPLNFLTLARESKLFSHELGFKFAAVVGALLFILVLFKTHVRDKQRPILIFCLYAGYVALQALLPMEFFPFTAFPFRAYPESSSARYVKVLKVMEDGTIVPLESHPVLGHFSGGRPKKSWDKIFNAPQACDRFAKAYSAHDFKKDPRVGRPLVHELHFESWKWDWVRDAQAAEKGFLVQRMICKA